MSNITTLKRRIGSVKNTKQLTKAMQLVSASKMRKAQAGATSSRPYREAAHTIFGHMSTISDVRRHPLFSSRPIKSRLSIVITSDRGLAGAYDSNVLKLLTQSIVADESKRIKSQVIAIGRQAGRFVGRVDNVKLVAAYPMFSKEPTPADIRPIITTALDLFEKGEVDAVEVIYTEFISNMSQVAKTVQLLPAHKPEEKKISELENAFFEPSIDAIVEDATLRLIEAQLWQALLESLASEHSMRMIAMKNATDNASDIIDDLTLEFNTARQAAITQEIAEIAGGAEAVSA